MEENKDAKALFMIFEPKNYGKEEYHIFNLFTPYKQFEADILLTRIKKIHYKEKVDCSDYQLLRNEDYLLNSRENNYGVTLTVNNSKFFSTNSTNQPPKRDFSSSMATTKGKIFKSKSKPFLDSTNKFSHHNNSGSFMAPVSHTTNKFTNIIIIVSIFLCRKEELSPRKIFLILGITLRNFLEENNPFLLKILSIVSVRKNTTI